MSHVSLHTLANGVRVVLNAGISVPRAVVAVHVGVGFRHEAPAEEGLAHLFEHLMFRGSASLPGGGFADEVYAVGGRLSGTTHPDYTDYVQVVPPTELRRALFRDAERFRAPVFDVAELALQLRSIEQEIAHVRDLPPLGGFPWPLISRAAYASRAYRHDGYGDPRALSGVDPAVCRAFFDRHYGPNRLLVTVSCPQDEVDVLPWIREEFGLLEPRSTPGAPTPHEAWPSESTGEVWMSPGLSAAHTAVALPTPDPATALDEYLATMVVAALLERPCAGDSAVRARCGVFGPLDTRAPDMLLATTASDPAIPGEAVADGIMGSVKALADVSANNVADAAERLAAIAERTNADLPEYTRALGRTALLFGDPEVASELPARLRRVTTSAVRAVSARLGECEPRWTRVEPGAERVRPLPDGKAPAVPPRPPREAEQSARFAPGLVAAPALHAVTADERRLPCGVRAVAVRDPRAAQAEVRLRVPVAGIGWQRPGAAMAAWRAAAERAELAGLRAVAGLELHVRCTGQWADVSVSAPSRALGVVCAVLARTVAAVRPAATADPYRAGAPDTLLSDVLRAGWTAAEDGTRVLDPAAAVLVIVTADTPGEALSVAATAFDDVALTPVSPVGSPQPAPLRTVVNALRAERPAGAPAEEYLDLLFAGPEPTLGSDAAARYLATTVLGGYPGSRLATWCRRFETRVVDMSAMRDRVGPYARVAVRVRTPLRLATTVAAVVGETLDGLIAEPPHEDELRGAARYAHNQFHGAFDSPALLADAFRHSMAAGRHLDWILQRSSLLLDVAPSAVSSAATMFTRVSHSAVVIGETDDGEAADLARRITLAHSESVN